MVELVWVGGGEVMSAPLGSAMEVCGRAPGFLGGRCPGLPGSKQAAEPAARVMFEADMKAELPREKWYPRQDLNLRPFAPEANALIH
jgi:hypothetical protein